MEDLSLQRYFEIIQAEGLLYKSLGIDAMHSDDMATDPNRSMDSTKLVISTADPDRMNDVLDPHGLILDNFKRNPLFLFEHGKRTDPAQAILGRINGITQTDTGVIADAQYMPLDHNKLPEQIWEMEKKGLIPGNSIGWRPLGNIRQQDGKRYIGTWELLEVSKVLLPMNGRAVNPQLAR